MQAPATLHVSDVINRHRLGAFQFLVVTICFLVVAIDGFDTAAIGFLAPAIRAEWQLSPAQLGPLFGSGLLGLMCGAFLFGPLADRFGRKTVLLACVAFFGLACAASATSGSLWSLIAWRFVTGLGLGGAMPNAVTLTSEYCPERRRLMTVTTMFCGFTVGSALGGLVSAQLVGAYGWRSVLVLGGVLPLALLPLMAWRLPESARYLVQQGGQDHRVAAILARIAPAAELRGARFAASHPVAAGSPARHLFRPDLLRGTLLLWSTFFASLLVIYLLSSWLPTLVKTTGVSLKTASLVTAMFQVGGTLGAIVLGWAMDRFAAQRVLAIAYATAALCIAAIGLFAATPWLVGMAVFWAGFCLSGAQVGANALAASYYPTDCRATGVSWANGVGRIGSVLGSLAGGALLGMNLSLATLFLLIGLPPLVSALMMLGLGRQQDPRVEPDACHMVVADRAAAG